MKFAVVLAILLVAVPAFSQSGSQVPVTYDVSVVAGVESSPAIKDGIGDQADFLNPTALWGDGSYLYVADETALRRIEIATQQVTTITRLAGSGRYSAADAYSPGFGAALTGMWGDGSYIYLTDVGQGTIRRVNLSTNLVDVMTSLGGYPNGVVGDGQYLYAGVSTGNIFRIDAVTGAATKFATLPGPFDPATCVGSYTCINYVLPSPTSLSIDGDNIYATGFATNLRIINKSTDQITSSPTLPSIPRAVWESGGVAYFTSRTGQLSQLDKMVLSTGDVSIVYQSTYSLGPLWGDPNNLYFVEGSHILRMDRSTGTVQSFAGSNNTPIDGVGTAARFGGLRGVWSDGTSLFTVDTVLSQIRKVNLATAEVSTLPTPLLQPGGLWGDGTYLYVTEANGTTLPGADPASGIVQRIRLSDGGTTTFGPTQQPGYGVWGDGTVLYVSEGTQLQRVPLDGSAISTLATGFAGGGGYVWGDGSNVYVGFCQGALCGQVFRYSIATGQITAFATLPDGFVLDGIWDDGQNLFVTIFNSGNVLRISLSTGEIDPLMRGGTGPDAGTELKGVPGGIWGDGTNLYVLGGTAIYKFTPSTMPPFSGFQAPDQGASSNLTTSSAAAITVGSASIELDATSAAVSGFAIFTYRQNGIVISETAVPASAAILSGRIYASTASPANTGIAIVNPNNQAATINFYFTDSGGYNFGAGSFVIPAQGQISRFLSEAPFVRSSPSGTSSAVTSSFTFSSSVPVSAIALRGYTNERSAFLMTTLPVVDLSAAASMDPIIMAHFADGGGWMTSVILVNPTDQGLSGNIEFHADDGSLLTTAPYAISPRSSFVYGTLNLTSQIQTGSVRAIPAVSTAAPSGVSIFSFRKNGIVVTEAGAPAIAPSPSFRLYTDSGGTGFLSGTVGSFETGVAVVNPSSSSITVNFEFSTPDGFPKTIPNYSNPSLTIPAQGHLSLFIEELSEKLVPPDGLTSTGVLRIWTNSPGGISMTGLRERYNERGDFLVANTPPSPEVANATPAPLYFPHVVEGGGYTTQIVIFGDTPGRGASGSILYFSQSGTPMMVPLY